MKSQRLDDGSSTAKACSSSDHDAAAAVEGSSLPATSSISPSSTRPGNRITGSSLRGLSALVGMHPGEDEALRYLASSYRQVVIA